MEKLKRFWKEYWLMALIILQPLLDILAFWTADPVNTPSGYIRLVIMAALPLYLLITMKEKKPILLSMVVIGVFCVLHFLNCFRVGYIDMRFDITYMAKVVQMPVMAICLFFLIRDERTKAQAIKGIVAAAAVSIAALLLAVFTGTANSTYGEGLGVSGWVIDDNRCANSVLLVTFATFLIYTACRSEKKWVSFCLPAAAVTLLIVNGTKACYYSVFALTVGFAAFLVLDRLVHKTGLRTALVAWLMVIAVVSAAIYPITPRCRVDRTLAESREKVENEIVKKLTELGYDLSAMTDEDKLADPVVKQVFIEYYWNCIGPVVPYMFDRFSHEEILMKYGFSTDENDICDTRLMKKNYASLVWDTQDTLTKLVGYEPSDVWFSTLRDVENDWPALYFYTGWLGFGMYVLFTLYILWLVIKRCVADLSGALTLENFALLVCFALHLGLAQFSGSVLRRPNVSVYTAICAALIYYKTVVVPVRGEVAE